MSASLTKGELLSQSHHAEVVEGVWNGRSVVFKTSTDLEQLGREALALKSFQGFGAAQLLKAGPGQLIMEKSEPGVPLKSLFPDHEEEAIEITARLIQRLHQAPLPQGHPFPSLREWLSSLDHATKIPSPPLKRAQTLRDKLLASSSKDVLLHGDLHHSNILKNKNGWTIIDPKGVIGDPAYEVSAFIRNPTPDLLNQPHLHLLLHHRMSQFSNLLGITLPRIQAWSFVSTVLAWAWALEDEVPHDHWEALAMILQET